MKWRMLLLSLIVFFSTVKYVYAVPYFLSANCYPTTVDLGYSVSCNVKWNDTNNFVTVRALDWFCQFSYPSPNSWNSYGDSAYASTGWFFTSASTASSTGITFACPQKSNQWAVPGTYTIKICITDGDDPYGTGMGYGCNWQSGTASGCPTGYSICTDKTINILSAPQATFYAVEPIHGYTYPFSPLGTQNILLKFGMSFSQAASGTYSIMLYDFNTSTLTNLVTAFFSQSGSAEYSTTSFVANGHQYDWYVDINSNLGNFVSPFWRFFVSNAPFTQSSPRVSDEKTCRYNVTNGKRIDCFASNVSFPASEVETEYILQASKDLELFGTTKICFYQYNLTDVKYSYCGYMSQGTYNDNLDRLQHGPIVVNGTYKWLVSLDDLLNPVVSSRTMTYTLIGNVSSVGAEPIVSLNYPLSNQVFPPGTYNVVLNATVNDTDSPMISSFIFYFDYDYIPRNQMKEIFRYTNIPANSTRTAQVPSDYLEDSKRYKWCAIATDSNGYMSFIDECRYFSISPPPNINPLPIITDLKCNKYDVGLNEYVNCTVFGYDPNPVSSPYVWFDLFCNFDSSISWNAFYPQGPNQEFASIGWGNAIPNDGINKSRTFVCPSYKDYGQWNHSGTYKVLGCITDGNNETGGLGFNYPFGYSVCMEKEIKIGNYSVTTVGFLDIPNCLVGDEQCLLPQFYKGLFAYFNPWITIFIWILISVMLFALMLRLYYWVKSK